jgi:transposase
MRFGLGVLRSRRTFMGNGSGVSRGDRNRNARLERLRALVPVTNAIAGIDLAGGRQMVVVTDHDWKGSSRGGRSGAVPGSLARRWTGPQAAPRRRAGRG